MKRTLFDKIFLFFLGVIFAFFAILIAYTTYATKNILISERQNTLTNEALLISKQTIVNYLNGEISLSHMVNNFNDFEDDLNVKVWFVNYQGDIIAVSHEENYENLPSNLYDIDESIPEDKSFTLTGDFFGIFKEDMITVGYPIHANGVFLGYLVLHSSIVEINSLKNDFFTITYMPFLIIVCIAFILLAFLSKKILQPIQKINEAARAYATGDFDVKINIPNKDELGELAASLEYMADELSKLEEYRRSFISNVSHDFRSPLTSIKGYIEAILDNTIPPEKHSKYLNIVLSETKRLTKLTSSLLELNSFNTSDPVLKKTEFNVLTIVHSTVNTFEGTCDNKNILLDVTCTTTSPVVYADKGKIQQVIYNLLDNAIKFSPEHSIITIQISERKDKIFVSVRDEGVGIDADKQKKVWDRFYKTDSSRGKDKQGTGLGLSITKEIIKAHGENITLISTPGVGSEFIFSLPKNK